MTSTGHTHTTASTSSLSNRRGRPGCTRYQWPSSIASVTHPRKAAPASVRSRATAGLPPASRPAATRPTTPIAAGTRSSVGGYSGPADRSAVAERPLDPGHRRHPGGAPVVLGPLAARPPGAGRSTRRGRRHIPPRRPATPPPGRARPRRRCRPRTPPPWPGRSRQQPAVAEPDLAPPGREPAERHPARGPLEQHRRAPRRITGAEGNAGPCPYSVARMLTALPATQAVRRRCLCCRCNRRDAAASPSLLSSW